MRPLLPLVAACVLCVLPLTMHAAVFTDVSSGVSFGDAILALKEKGIVNGYADGSFQPYRSLNRAEFLKILMASLPPKTERLCLRKRRQFSDVSPNEWYWQSVCQAKARGIIKGYENNTFKPFAPVTLADASSMLMAAFGEKPEASEPWYKNTLAYLAEKNAIPESLGYPLQIIRRGEAAEILWRLLEKKQNLPSVGLGTVLAAQCVKVDDVEPGNVDMQAVTAEWLAWINGARRAAGLAPYAADRQLERTAIIWSQEAKKNGAITHQRPGQTLYYDYTGIEDWFRQLGLEFKNVNRVTFTENIGRGYVQCPAKGDCTEQVIKAVRTTFDYYMAEKGKASSPHYNSVMNPEFTEIGAGLVLDLPKKAYYITTHYATAITSNPAPVCL